MKYFRSTDYDLCYNKSAANYTISSIERLISEACRNIDNLEYYLQELEKNAHDKQGTTVDEDCKDFEEILGYNSVTGLLQELSYEMDDLKSDMRSYERIVAENQERRRREEAARRAAAAAAAAAARRRY